MENLTNPSDKSSRLKSVWRLQSLGLTLLLFLVLYQLLFEAAAYPRNPGLPIWMALSLVAALPALLNPGIRGLIFSVFGQLLMAWFLVLGLSGQVLQPWTWVILVLILWFYWKLSRSLWGFPHQATEFLRELGKGPLSGELSIPMQDERGLIHQALNQFAAYVREKELLSQYIAPEIWQEIQRDSSRSLMAAREQKACCLTLVTRAEGLVGARRIYDLGARIAAECRGFLAEHREDSIQLLFLEETEGYEKNALMACSRLNQTLMPGSIGGLRMIQVKTGLIARDEGLRLKALCQDMEEEVQRLKSRLGYPVQLWIHPNLALSAQRLFHLGKAEEGGIHPVTGEKDLDFHLENLRNARVEDKLVSIRVVEAHREESAITFLIELLDDLSPRVRIEAAKALSRLVEPANETEIGKAYLKALGQEWNHDCRATLVISLGELRRKEFVEPLFSLLRDENDRVRANAIEAIGKCMDRTTVVRYLEGMLYDQNNRARANAALALWLMGMKSGFVQLLEMSENDEPLLSCSGLYGVGEIFKDENIAIVEAHISHPESFWLKEKKSLFERARKICEDKLFHEHPLVERNALLALKKMGSRHAVPSLVLKFREKEDVNLRQQVLEALIAMDEFQLVSRLRQEARQ